VPLDTAVFAERWTGQLFALQPRQSVPEGESRVNPSLLTGSGVSAIQIAEIILAACGLQLLGLATPLVFQTVVDKVLSSHALATLDVMCVALAGVALFECLLGYLRSLSVARLGAQLEVRLGDIFFARLLARAPMRAAELPPSGIFARLRDLDAVRGFSTGSVLALIPDVLFISLFVAVMYHYSPALTRVILLAVPCLVCAAVLPGIFLRKPFDARLSRGAEAQALLLETVSAFSGLKAQAAEARQLARWRLALAHGAEATLGMNRIASIAAQTLMLVQKLCLVGVLWLGAHEVMQGRLTVGGLIAFNLLAGRALQPLLRLGQCWLEYQQVWLAWRRVREFLQTPMEFDWAVRPPGLPSPRGKIELQRVAFRYGDNAPEVLLDLDLGIAPGERIALTGPSGCGKSTLLALIHGRYPPSRGRIVIDDVPLAGRDPRWMRRHVGAVLSALPLVTGSVHDNIALRHPEATRAEVVRAARAAGVEGVILGLRNGYDTLLEGDPPFSGGELARLRLAQALLGEPPILLCDEPYEIATAMLEASTARQTCIVVSAHPAVFSRVDRVLVLASSGQIRQQHLVVPERRVVGETPETRVG
jgi:subfamily B ATP-binding cassette protein HlyB/CyaB